MPSSTTRRAFLAVGACAGLAGCTVPWEDDTDPWNRQVSVDLEALAAMVEDVDDPVPARSIPVAIAEDQLDEHRSRTEELLDAIPSELTATIPNGLIREHVVEHRDDARGTLEANAVTSYERVKDLHRAVATAGVAEGTYATAVDDRTEQEIVDEWTSVEGLAGKLDDAWSYVAEQPLSAIVVHGAIEELEREAMRVDDELDSPFGNPIEAGDAAGNVERARARLRTARHLAEQFDASLDDPVELGQLDAVVDTQAERLAELAADRPAPDVEGTAGFFDRASEDVGRTPADAFGVLALGSVGERLDDARSDASEGAVATAVLELAAARRNDAALETIRDRIDPEWLENVDAVAPLRESRARAVSAIEDTLAATEHRPITEKLLYRLGFDLSRTDARLAIDSDRRDSVPGRRLDRAFAQYEWTAARAGAIPETVAWLEDVLGDASGTD